MEPGFRLAVGSHIVWTFGWAGVARNALTRAQGIKIPQANAVLEVPIQKLNVCCAARGTSPTKLIFEPTADLCQETKGDYSNNKIYKKWNPDSG